MKNTFWKRERIEIMIALALFNYVFLGAEYLFDNMMAFQTDSGGVVLAPELCARKQYGWFSSVWHTGW